MKLIKLSKSSIGEKEKEEICKILSEEFLGMGSEVERFETNLSSYFLREVVCVVNGTAAIHLALQAIGIKFGDEVLVPSLTYISTYQAIMASGAIPVSCDIDLENLTIDLEDAKNKLTKKTKAIIPVHYAGVVKNLDLILKFGNENNLRVIEDAAHAFGSKLTDRKIGSFGDIACFSFDGIKNITSGEGGCVVTNDLEVITKIKDARLLGIEKDTENRYNGQRSWMFDVKNIGWRYHMSNIMAAIGNVQFQRLNEFSLKRQYLAKYYNQKLENISFISFLNHNYDEVVPHIYVIKILGLFNREGLRDELLNKFNIQTGYHYFPNHNLTLFNSGIVLPNTTYIFPQLLTLPLHFDLSINEIDYIIESLLSVLPKYLSN